MKERVLLVGGAGYVGSVLTRQLLEAGYSVRVMDNISRANADNLIPLCKDPKFEFVFGDITSDKNCSDALKGIDVIINLAAVVGAPACAKYPGLASAVNVDGVENLLSYRTSSQRLIFCSTECVYGKSQCIEDSKPAPTSIYATQKFFSESSILEEKNTVCFRFAAGMGLSHNIRTNLLVNTLVYEAVKNNVLTIYQADVLRNFIHVEDMGRVLQFGLNCKQNLYNAGDIACTKRELAEAISKKTGCHLFYGDIAQDVDNRALKLDNSRIKAEGFQFIRDMDSTLDELVKGMRVANIKHNYE